MINSIKPRIVRQHTFTNVFNHSNLVDMINTWMNNRIDIEHAFNEQPNKCFNFGNHKVKFSGIDNHITINSDYRICAFPVDRNYVINVPWYTLASLRSVIGGDTTLYSQSINNSVSVDCEDSYNYFYNLFVDVFKHIDKQKAASYFKNIISNSVSCKHKWHSINDGAIYIHGSSWSPQNLVYYKTEDWSVLSFDDIIDQYDVGSITSITPCEDPHDIHWDLLIKIQHNREVEARVAVNNYVSTVFEKIRNHVTIPLEARAVILHDIKDVVGFERVRKKYNINKKYFNSDTIQKAINTEQKNLDNILFGIYTGKL